MFPNDTRHLLVHFFVLSLVGHLLSLVISMIQSCCAILRFDASRSFVIVKEKERKALKYICLRNGNKLTLKIELMEI